MSDPVSDPTYGPLRHPLSAAARQSFQERIADHVAAIVAAARELNAAVASNRTPAPDREAAATPLPVVSVTVADPTVLHIPLQPGGCAEGEIPFFYIYEAGHFLDGTPYYAQDVWCV